MVDVTFHHIDLLESPDVANFTFPRCKHVLICCQLTSLDPVLLSLIFASARVTVEPERNARRVLSLLLLVTCFWDSLLCLFPVKPYLPDQAGHLRPSQPLALFPLIALTCGLLKSLDMWSIGLQFAGELSFILRSCN